MLVFYIPEPATR